MYLLFMIKARIRWCTCRVENILTLGKLVSLWFVSSSILFVFDISNLLSYIQISSYELARPIMGTIFLVIIRTAFSKEEQFTFYTVKTTASVASNDAPYERYAVTLSLYQKNVSMCLGRFTQNFSQM